MKFSRFWSSFRVGVIRHLRVERHEKVRISVLQFISFETFFGVWIFFFLFLQLVVCEKRLIFGFGSRDFTAYFLMRKWLKKIRRLYITPTENIKVSYRDLFRFPFVVVLRHPKTIFLSSTYPRAFGLSPIVRHNYARIHLVKYVIRFVYFYAFSPPNRIFASSSLHE